ncbi:46109_t:CDS:2, partial [Gigaspora margarita]
AACALGLLENTTEYEQCFNESLTYNCIPGQLRLLFCRLIIEGIAAQTVWQNYHELLSAYYITKKEDMREGEEHGIKITETGLPQLPNHLSEVMHIKTQYSNYEELTTKREEMICKLNYEQKIIYQKIIYHISKNILLVVFINGRAGHAALNYIGGRTAHLLFNIPVEYSEEGYKCQIKSNSERAKLIQEASAIAWNELSMVQKGNIEAVDILLRELCDCNLPFGGKVFIGIGDFHQVAPVIPNARKTAIILESIKSSTIWNSFKVYNLQQPIRDANDPEYSKFMDDIGDGINGENISLPLLNKIHELDKAINFVFPPNILNNPVI